MTRPSTNQSNGERDMKAQKCPVCNGGGQINDNSWSTTSCNFNKKCHGCDGRGWVEVREDTFNMPSKLEDKAIRSSRKTIFN